MISKAKFIALLVLAPCIADAQISSSNPSISPSAWDWILRSSEPSQQSQSVSYMDLNLSGEGPAYGVSFSRMQLFTTASEFHSIFRSQRKDDEDIREDVKKLNDELDRDQVNEAAEVMGQIEDRRIALQDGIFRERNNDREVLRLGNELLDLELIQMRMRLGLNNADNDAQINRAIRTGGNQIRGLSQGNN